MCLFTFVGGSLVVDQVYWFCNGLSVEWEGLGKHGYFRWLMWCCLGVVKVFNLFYMYHIAYETL